MEDLIRLFMGFGWAVAFTLGTLAQHCLKPLIVCAILIPNMAMFTFHTFFSIYQIIYFTLTWKWREGDHMWKKLTICKFPMWWKETITDIKSAFVKDDTAHY